MRWIVIVTLAMLAGGCAGATGGATANTPISRWLLESAMRQGPSFRENSYDDGVLESVAPKDRPGEGNRDAVFGFPAPGTIRLGVSGDCSRTSPNSPLLCDVRNEIREKPGLRAAFDRPNYYGIALRLAEAGVGARNMPGDPRRNERLMVAQIKFDQHGGVNRTGLASFSPLLALRLEDGRLFATADLMGRIVPLRLAGNGCTGGFLGKVSRDRAKRHGPFRLLLSSEDGHLPFDFNPRYQTDVRCINLGRFRPLSFHAVPRDRFVDVVMTVDGGEPDDATVRMYLDGKLAARAHSDIARGVDARRSYFKFGIYGDLAPGRALAVEARSFRRAQRARDLGLDLD